MIRKFPILFVLLFISSCGGPKPASLAVAEQFMESYYVRADLPTVIPLTDGYALDKIQKGVTLTEGVTKDDSVHHPKVSYQMIESRQEDAEAVYFFLVTYKPDKASPVRKKTLVKVRERPAGTWRVTQFSDYEMESP